MAYSPPHSAEALNSADAIRHRILGTFEERYGYDLLSFEDALAIDEDFFRIAFKPYKWTLLHRFAQNCLWEEWNYLRRKADEEFVLESSRLLQHFKIPFSDEEYSDISKQKDYLFELLQEPLKRITHEVFCILFNDKKLMRCFGERISDAIADINPSQYPLYVHAQGRLKRSSSWPAWLRDALFYRENGRCAECSNSLTGVFDTSLKPQIDHIVPISKGGTTDPTNLQTLCESCNKKKGNSSSQVGGFIYIPWECELY